MEQVTLINVWGIRGQCSNRRQVSNKCRVSIKRWGLEVRVLMNAWHLLEVLRHALFMVILQLNLS